MMSPNPTAVRSALRPLLFVLGWILLVVGIAGVFLPLLPGTVFLIMAAGCFSRSSPRFERWLLNHPRFGPTVVAWRENGSISRRGKALALTGMAAGFAVTWYSDAPRYAVAIVAVVMIGSALYVGSRPTGPVTPP